MSLTTVVVFAVLMAGAWTAWRLYARPLAVGLGAVHFGALLLAAFAAGVPVLGYFWALVTMTAFTIRRIHPGKRWWAIPVGPLTRFAASGFGICGTIDLSTRVSDVSSRTP